MLDDLGEILEREVFALKLSLANEAKVVLQRLLVRKNASMSVFGDRIILVDQSHDDIDAELLCFDADESTRLSITNAEINTHVEHDRFSLIDETFFTSVVLSAVLTPRFRLILTEGVFHIL